MTALGHLDVFTHRANSALWRGDKSSLVRQSAGEEPTGRRERAYRVTALLQQAGWMV